MKKLFIIISIIILIGLIMILFLNKDSRKEQNIKTNEESVEQKDGIKVNEKESKKVKLTINDKEYDALFEVNETTKELFKKLPLELTMSDLNNNEKYIYLDFELPNNPYNPHYVEKGDIMLFSRDCLVIFYKSFDTTFSYTKIGHIENLDDFDLSDIKVRIEK